MSTAIDVHQHLWPEQLVEALRARNEPPYLRGWTLHTSGEPAYDVQPHDHDAAARVELDLEGGTGLACLSLSAPLGIESLPDGHALLKAWHTGVEDLPEHFRAWASVTTVDPDLDELAGLLAGDRFIGLQVPATSLLTPSAWETLAPVLAVVQQAGRPVLVHPGPARGVGEVPGWWPAVVDYVNQMQAAWWGWQAVDGRALLPDLRILFAAAAGLAPVHHERHVIRGGQERPVDAGLFVDSSGYGPRALDPVVRALGIDALVLGSDRPYAEPLAELFGDAATHALRVANPTRLLGLPAGPVTPVPPASPTHDERGDPR